LCSDISFGLVLFPKGYNSAIFIQECGGHFCDDQSHIHWVLSFMKTGCAFDFKNQILNYQPEEGKPHFADFAAFAEAFKEKFFPLEPGTRAGSLLEGKSYWQGDRSLDEYMDQFTLQTFQNFLIQKMIQKKPKNMSNFFLIQKIE